MDNSISKYVKFLRDLENGLVEEEREDKRNVALIESIESVELFEDHGISFEYMGKKLSITKEEVLEIFDILKNQEQVKQKLKKVNDLIGGGGVDRYKKDGMDVLYVVMSDVYNDTILSTKGNFYFGSLGRMIEEGDMNTLSRIS